MPQAHHTNPFLSEIHCALSKKRNMRIWDRNFDSFLGGASVTDDRYEIAGHCKDHEALWKRAAQGFDTLTPIARSSCKNYNIVLAKDFDPITTFLFYKETPVGFYSTGMLWIDPEHRFQGIGTALVILTCEHVGANPLRIGRLNPFPDDGLTNDKSPLGFSYAGLNTHYKAYSLAREILRIDNDVQKTSAASNAQNTKVPHLVYL